MTGNVGVVWLNWITTNSSFILVKWVLFNFSDTSACDSEGKTALHYCASSKASKALPLTAMLSKNTQIGKWIACCQTSM